MPMSIESLWTKKSSPGLTQRGCLNIFLFKRTDLTARMGPNLSRHSIKSACRPGRNLILHRFSFSAFGVPKRQATGRTTCGTLTAKSIRDRETIAHRLGADPESWNRSSTGKKTWTVRFVRVATHEALCLRRKGRMNPDSDDNCRISLPANRPTYNSASDLQCGRSPLIS